MVNLHGVNEVQKWPAEDPLTPAETGFDADDAAFIRAQGWNVVRLGFVFNAIMPEPGVIDDAYVASLAETTRLLAAEGVYVLLDAHQDGFGPLVNGNGFPDWATLTDGLPNPPAEFPAYYIENPALQRAFENSWANRLGPDGAPLQEHYAEALAAAAAAVADSPAVMGYDVMNEPWPGADWTSCLTPGCPEEERALLAPFAARMESAIHTADPDGLVFTEPFTLFNFGKAETAVSGFVGEQSGLSFHVYATSPEDDEAAIDLAIAAGDQTDALMATEFGATNDPGTIERLTGALDSRLVPWTFWAYHENVIVDPALPPSGDNVRVPVVTALARPYATATNGTPEASAFDPAGRTLTYRYATTRPDGSAAPLDLATVLEAPAGTYPDGYTVEVTGGAVTSEPGAAQLLVCNDAGAATIEVRIVPGADADASAPVACKATPPGEVDPTPAGPTPAGAPAATPVRSYARFTG